MSCFLPQNQEMSFGKVNLRRHFQMFWWIQCWMHVAVDGENCLRMVVRVKFYC